MNRLDNCVAVVMGAGSIAPGWGNGKATAVTFAREGAVVACVDANMSAAQETAEIICSEGGKAHAYCADVSIDADIARVIAEINQKFGKIDVLDNNVGIARLGGVTDTSEADWDLVMAVNLKSAYLAMKHVIPIMVDNGGGSIINISSLASISYSGIPYVGYSASKAALNHLTRVTAAEETADIIQSEGGKALAFTADVSRAAEVEAMVAACLKAYVRIDVLDNNVGIAEMGDVVEVTEAEWDRVFAVNLKSAFLAMKHVIPVMQRQGGGSIINISSIASIRHLGISYVSYGTSKAAMNMMTKTTAVQFARDHVRVNAILPGLMKTPMV
ncbi:MAG: SDR family NAD(P)-dependent oxidoreductase, partial [Rhodococcus sp. (in: high G+C Gram-positive bacteria)]